MKDLMVAYVTAFTLYGWHCLIRRPGVLYYQSVPAKDLMSWPVSYGLIRP
jgi:hypothetical protein